MQVLLQMKDLLATVEVQVSVADDPGKLGQVLKQLSTAITDYDTTARDTPVAERDLFGSVG